MSSLIFELQTGTMSILFFCNLLHVETSLKLDFLQILRVLCMVCHSRAKMRGFFFLLGVLTAVRCSIQQLGPPFCSRVNSSKACCCHSG